MEVEGRSSEMAGDLTETTEHEGKGGGGEGEWRSNKQARAGRRIIE